MYNLEWMREKCFEVGTKTIVKTIWKKKVDFEYVVEILRLFEAEIKILIDSGINSVKKVHLYIMNSLMGLSMKNVVPSMKVMLFG